MVGTVESLELRERTMNPISTHEANPQINVENGLVELKRVSLERKVRTGKS